MADNKINYDYISGKLKTETAKHFDVMRANLDKAAQDVDGMGWSGSSANFYKDTIDEVKAKITTAQEAFNAKLDTDYTTILSQYGQAEADIQKDTGTIE